MHPDPLNRMKRPDYDGAELRNLVTMPPERYHAFTLPSIINSHRVWPDGRREPLENTNARQQEAA